MKKMMAAALICCLLPLLPARAQSVPAQVQAPERVQTQFLSKTGKTTINIDAPVIVPEAEAAYLLPVQLNKTSPDMVHKFADLILPGIKWDKNEDSYSTINGGTHYSYTLLRKDLNGGNDRYDASAGYSLTKNGVVFQNIYSFSPYLDHKKRTGTRIYYWGKSGSAIENDGIPGHKLNTEEALAVSEAFLRQLTDEPMALFYVADSFGAVLNDELMLAHKSHMGHSYKMIYTRIVAGMPVLSFYQRIRDAETYANPIGYEFINIALDEEGKVTSFRWVNQSEIGAEKEEQVLLPFDQVLDVASAILPLKVASKENEGPVQVDIHTIRLGYMPVLQRNRADTFMLTPVWNFYGFDVKELSEWPQHADLNDAFLTVNAIDGTMIDPEYGY